MTWAAAPDGHRTRLFFSVLIGAVTMKRTMERADSRDVSVSRAMVTEIRAHRKAHPTCQVRGCSSPAVKVEARTSAGNVAMRSVCAAHARTSQPSSVDRPAAESEQASRRRAVELASGPDHMARLRKQKVRRSGNDDGSTRS